MFFPPLGRGIQVLQVALGIGLLVSVSTTRVAAPMANPCARRASFDGPA